MPPLKPRVSPARTHMNEEDQTARPHDVRIELPTIASDSQLYPPVLWQTYSFAPEWFADADREAAQSGYQARRREIVFAVCAAESYLFEWVRDTVLSRDFVRLSRYFQPSDRRSVSDKFKVVPKALADDGLISAPLDCGGTEFDQFKRLVDYRNGLVHARASRPSTGGLSPDSQPRPSKSDLDSIAGGWATRVVRRMLEKLHQNSKTERPEWLWLCNLEHR
jgi:hypothetical protein